MALLIPRGDVVMTLCTHLKARVPDLMLVKPYLGELDRYSKRTQVKAEAFPAQVNLTTPFALVISKDRARVPQTGQSRKFKHDLSLYVGVANTHDYGSQAMPPIFPLLDKCLAALDGVVLIRGAGELTVDSDGEYLITTELFTIYDQRYFQYEIGS